jgi:hypothetical protein
MPSVPDGQSTAMAASARRNGARYGLVQDLRVDPARREVARPRLGRPWWRRDRADCRAAASRSASLPQSACSGRDPPFDWPMHAPQVVRRSPPVQRAPDGPATRPLPRFHLQASAQRVPAGWPSTRPALGHGGPCGPTRRVVTARDRSSPTAWVRSKLRSRLSGLLTLRRGPPLRRLGTTVTPWGTSVASPHPRWHDARSPVANFNSACKLDGAQ